MRLRSFPILLEPAATDLGGGGTPPPKTEEKAPDLVKAIEGLLAKHGNDPNAVFRTLLTENHGYRDQLRDVKAKLPAEGHVVLDPEKAKTFGAYQALGSIEDISKGLTEGKDAVGQVAKFKRAEVLTNVSKVAGYDPDVLATLAGDLEFEIADGKDKAGKPIKVVSVNDGDKSVPLEEFAAAKWEKFLPSLKPAAVRPIPGGSPPSANHTSPKPPIIKTGAPRPSLVR